MNPNDRVRVPMRCWQCGEAFMYRVPPWNRCWCQVCGWVLVDASCSGFPTVEVAST